MLGLELNHGMREILIDHLSTECLIVSMENEMSSFSEMARRNRNAKRKSLSTTFDQISIFLPEKWERVVVYLEYGEDSFSCSFYVKKDGEYLKCYDLPEVSEASLINAFKQIDKVVQAEREKAKGELWSNMTMIVDNEGNMHTDFDYTDLSVGSYKYSKKWKSQYLK